MVIGANKLFHSDYSIAVTGFAGPGGGTDEAPVGTIWIAVGNAEKIVTQNAWINADKEPSPTPAAVIKRMLRKYPPGIRLNVQQLLPDRQMIPGAHSSRQRQYWPLPPL